jgi:hypothetical protein
MVFNIGNQSGGVVNNVAGNQYISHGQHGIGTLAEARSAARALRITVDDIALPDPARDWVRNDAREVERALDSDEPDRGQVARQLERITDLLSRSGALAAAGAGLVGPLTILGQWLGAAGAPLLQILGG